MSAMRKLGYARVSTSDQNLDLQIDALRAAGCEEIFQDQGISGAALNRPGLETVLSALQPGDALLIWKLDRLGRSNQHLLEIVSDLKARNVSFQSLSDYIDTSNAMGKLAFHMLAAFAEFERNLISERTKAGMEAARLRGAMIGRQPALSAEQVESALALIKSGRATIPSAARVLGVHRTTLWRALKARREEAQPERAELPSLRDVLFDGNDEENALMACQFNRDMIEL